MEISDVYEAETSQRIQELIRQWRNRSVMSWPDSVVNTNFDGLNLSLRVSYDHWAFAIGHFADVHRGTIDGGAVVAVKLLRLPEFNSYNEEVYETTLQRFFRELNHWGELAHTNIVQMLGFTLANGRVGLVSPWQQNGTLVQYLRVNPSASQPDLMLDVAEGTQYLHTVARLVHGDLKGLNVLVSENGVARLADFGISQQMNDITRTTGFTTTSAMKGTPAWMAPENIKGLPLDFPSDIYSCAGVFLEIASGHHPYHYITEVHRVVAEKMVNAPDRRFYPELANKDLLWQIFCDCWRLDPAQRPKIGEVVRLLYHDSKLSPRLDPTIALRPLVDNTQAFKEPDIPSPSVGLSPQSPTNLVSDQEEFGGIETEVTDALSSSQPELGLLMCSDTQLHVGGAQAQVGTILRGNRLAEAIEALINNETRNIDDLDAFIDHVIRPLLRKGASFTTYATESFIADTFGNILELRDISSLLLEKVRHSAGEDKSAGLVDLVSGIRASITRMNDAYTMYIKNLPSAKSNLESEIKINHIFWTFSQECVNYPAARGRDLVQLIFLPVSHLKKFSKLSEAILGVIDSNVVACEDAVSLDAAAMLSQSVLLGLPAVKLERREGSQVGSLFSSSSDTQRPDLCHGYQGSEANSTISARWNSVINLVRGQLYAAGDILGKKKTLSDIVRNRSRNDRLVKAGVQVSSLFVMVPTLVATSVGAVWRPVNLPSERQSPSLPPAPSLEDSHSPFGPTRWQQFERPRQARSSANSRSGGGSRASSFISCISPAAPRPYRRSVLKPTRIAATAWDGSVGSAHSCGVRVYSTSSTFNGIQELSSSGIPTLSEVPNYVSTHFFDADLLGLIPEDGFMVTSVETDGVLKDIRLFYWARNLGVPEIRDLYWNPNMGADWKRPEGGSDPRLTLRVLKADTSQVAAVSWHQRGYLFWSVFYIDDGYVKEVTRSTSVFSNWSRTRRVYQLNCKKVGSLQAIASVDGDHVNKAVYILDSESQTLYTLPWSFEDGGQKPTILSQRVLAFTLCNNPAGGFSSTRIYIQEAGSQGLVELRPPSAEGGSTVLPEGMARRQVFNDGRDIERPARLASAIQARMGAERCSVFYTDINGRLIMRHHGPAGEWEAQEELILH